MRAYCPYGRQESKTRPDTRARASHKLRQSNLCFFSPIESLPFAPVLFGCQSPCRRISSRQPSGASKSRKSAIQARQGEEPRCMRERRIGLCRPHESRIGERLDVWKSAWANATLANTQRYSNARRMRRWRKTSKGILGYKKKIDTAKSREKKILEGASTPRNVVA